MTHQSMDWEVLQQEWQRGGSSDAEVATALERLSRARRGLRFTWLAETVIGVSSLVFVMMALRHAHNPLVATLGVIVCVGNAIVWAQRVALRRREQASASAPGIDYLAAIRRLLIRQIRLAEFAWAVLTMELIFFIPWWVIGSRVHSRRITNAGSLLTMWLPIVVMLALYVWAFRLRAAGTRDVEAIERLEADSNAV
jgi:drug/metabolite transporter (DMT)-like permease